MKITKQSFHHLLLASAAFIFGTLTLIASGSVIWGPTPIQKAAGQIIPFVVWFNFSAGFLYLTAALGFVKQQAWAVVLSLAIACLTLFVFGLFSLAVVSGQPYEMRTIWALLFRTGFWFGLYFVSRHLFFKQIKASP